MMKTKKYDIIAKLVIVLLSLTVLSCTPEQDEILFTGEEYQNILQFMEEESDQYSSFLNIVDAGNMLDVLSSYNSNIGGQNYTLFLPGNDDVINFIESNNQYGSLEDIIADTIFAKELVKYHILNREVYSDDFPNGALPTRTLSEDFLTIKFSNNGNVISYFLNNEASIRTINIEKSNGVIHVIDKMLSPVVYTGYEWIQLNASKGYSLFSQLLDITGLQDTLNAFVINDFGIKVYNKYTLFAESDELYKKNGIKNFSELVAFVGAEGEDYTSSDNKLNQYVRYHILNEGIFLDEFQSDNENVSSGIYDTYGDAPMTVDFGIDLKFNVGTENFEPIVQGGDTTGWIDYLMVDLEKSNILTKSGAIHQLDRLLKPFIPNRKTVEFQFFNDDMIGALKDLTGTYRIHRDDLTAIELDGVETMLYIRENSGIPGLRNRDYLSIYGNFSFIYTTPRILEGSYKVTVIAHGSSRAADFVTYVNGKALGGIQSLRQETSKWLTGGREKKILGNFTFTGYESQRFEIKTLFVGRLMIDRIIFEPI